MHKFFFYCFFLLMAIASYGQNLQIEKQLDELLIKQFKANQPGCAVLIAKKGQVIYNKAFGSADLELDVPVKPEMVFKLASLTKQFTAVAILQLIESGKIYLTDSVQKFIPDFPSKGNTITIENLLTHTSGIRDYLQIGYSNINMERWDFMPKQFIDSFKNYALEFEPGTRYSYSNSGYYLLGYIIEKVSGKSYESYIQDNLLIPLVLTHTYFDSEGTIIPGRVKGYQRVGKSFKNADYWSPTIVYAAGGLLANTEDLWKWFSGLLANKILRKETMEKAFTPFKLKDGSPITYGYGWHILEMNKIKSIEHNGKINGFLSNEIYYPQQEVFIAAFFNSQEAPRDEISRQISEIILGKSLQTTTVKPGEEVLKACVGTYALTSNPTRTVVVSKLEDHLFLKASGQQGLEILFKSTTGFQLKNVKDLTGEFVWEGNKVEKILIHQNGRFEWKKIK